MEEMITGVAEAYEDFINRYRELVDEASRVDTMVERRREAYQPFTRDQGMGMNGWQWISEAAEPFGFKVVGEHSGSFYIDTIPEEDEE